jgi:putative transposase
MARPLRLEFPGAHYHVSARADHRDHLFRDEADYQNYLELLGDICHRYAWQCCAYALLPSHYALVLVTRRANLARGMRQLNGIYAQRVNRRHGGHGHVFAGRYAAHAFAPTQGLAAMVREVLRLPVRSGASAYVEAWPWSSFALCVEPGCAPDWFARELAMGAVVGGASDRVAAFRDSISVGAAEFGATTPRPVLACLRDRGLLALGEHTGPRDVSEVPRRDRPAPPLASVVGEAPDRNAAMRAAYATGHYSLKQIAAHFGVHYATVSRAVAGAAGRGTRG